MTARYHGAVEVVLGTPTYLDDGEYQEDCALLTARLDSLRKRTLDMQTFTNHLVASFMVN